MKSSKNDNMNPIVVSRSRCKAVVLVQVWVFWAIIFMRVWIPGQFYPVSSDFGLAKQSPTFPPGLESDSTFMSSFSKYTHTLVSTWYLVDISDFTVSSHSYNSDFSVNLQPNPSGSAPCCSVSSRKSTSKSPEGPMNTPNDAQIPNMNLNNW